MKLTICTPVAEKSEYNEQNDTYNLQFCREASTRNKMIYLKSAVQSQREANTMDQGQAHDHTSKRK